MRGRLTSTLEGIMRKKGTAIQDEIVTVRNERFVIPVKSDFSGKVNGVAHGSSSSGATLFIEPLEVIEANNELQKLKAREESEIARILFSLAQSAREQLDGIEEAAAVVGELDFIKAKFEFYKRFEAVIPTVSDELELKFVDARHPLLEESLRLLATASKDKDSESGKRKDNPATGNGIVPVSFSLSNKNSVMIISGANAGGKTVVMKTAGLLSLMAVSGLPVPAKSAHVPFYSSILADIGDHQSLSANLSTFSSHISNIASMMERASSPALILLDEVGTGTDPDEGSALGVAIVDRFRNSGAQIIASTHYKGLKIYATNDDDVINASVEFDEKTLQPTYRLITGLAGASSGLEIARRFGIPDDVIDLARRNLDTASRKTEDYLNELQRETRIAADLRIALEEERDATADKYSKLDLDFVKKERARNEEFRTELDAVLNDFEQSSREFLKSVKDKKERKKLENEVSAARAVLRRKAEASVDKFTGVTSKTPASVKVIRKNEKAKAASQDTNINIISEPIEKGSNVMLKQFGTIGKVDKIEGKTAHLTVGSLRMKQNLNDLQPVEVLPKPVVGGTYKKKRTAGEKLDSKIEDQSTAHELNLIGLTTLDAEDEVDRFLEDSFIAKIMRVRIIHGHGTGALRNAVQTILRKHPHVESFGFAPQNEGGNGATVVELKE